MKMEDMETVRKACEVGKWLRVNKSIPNKAHDALSVWDTKYVAFEYLLQRIEESDFLLLKGSWLANEIKVRRLLRQQDLPPEAFWIAEQLRAEQHIVLHVAISYCWLDRAHPDPRAEHLATLRQA